MKEYNIYKFYDMLDKTINMGRRSFPQGIKEMEGVAPSFTWYEKTAYSIPHSHLHTEAVYYFGFHGTGENKARLVMGWPFSKAEIYEITGPTMIEIPPGVVHSFSNDGDTVMTFFCAYMPPVQKNLNQEMDVQDVVENKYFKYYQDYQTYANDLYKTYPTFDDFIQYLKDAGKY